MKILPNQPNLAYLRREAQAVKARHRAKDTSVCSIVGHYDTSLHGLSEQQIFNQHFSILDAQRVVARQYAFSSWSRLKLFVLKSSDTTELNSELSKLILERKCTYDAYLKRFKKTKWKDNAIRKWDNFNRESGDIFENIYDKYGWPGPNIIGREAVEASFCLTAANSNDSTFQKLTTKLMKEALPKGECFGIMYASLVDRCLSLSYRPTIYGTNYDFNEQTGRVELSRNVIDPENLDKRRAEVGLPGFESQYLEDIEIQLKRKQLQTDREDWEQYKRKTALKCGYIEA